MQRGNVMEIQIFISYIYIHSIGIYFNNNLTVYEHKYSVYYINEHSWIVNKFKQDYNQIIYETP